MKSVAQRCALGGRVEAENGLSVLHDADPVTGDDLDILGVVFEKMDFASVEVAACDLLPQDGLLLLKLAGQFLAAFDLRVKKEYSQQKDTCHDQPCESAVGLVPVFGFAAPLGAKLCHALSLLLPSVGYPAAILKIQATLQMRAAFRRDMPMLHRRTKRAALGFLALALVVAGVLSGTNRYLDAQKEKRRSEMERKELLAPPPVPVEVVSLPLERVRKFTAALVPWMTAGVPAEVAGRVASVFVEAGNRVSAGEVLIELDATRAQILLDAAALRLTETERLLKEAGRLREANAISSTAYESALSESRIARAQYAEALDTVERHKVKAPFDGTVNARLVDIGDAVNVNQPVVELVDLDKLRVELLVAESDLPAFLPGGKLALRLSSGRGGVLEPVVRFVGRSADPATRLFKVEAVLDNTGHDLPGGIQGHVEANVQEFPDGPVVPAVAVRFAGADAIVMVDTPEGPRPVKIKVGPEIQGKFPVLEGLKPGDKVYIQ